MVLGLGFRCGGRRVRGSIVGILAHTPAISLGAGFRKPIGMLLLPEDVRHKGQ